MSSALPVPKENPHSLPPLAYWAIAIVCLLTPFLLSDKWWIHFATIPVFWLLALMVFVIGRRGLLWQRARGTRDGRDPPCTFSKNLQAPWRPMSEAPRDGSLIIVVFGDRSGTQVMFHGETVEKPSRQGWFSFYGDVEDYEQSDFEAEEKDIDDNAFYGWVPFPSKEKGHETFSIGTG